MSMEIEQINNLGIRLLEEHSKLTNEVFNKNRKDTLTNFNIDLKSFINLVYPSVESIIEKINKVKMDAKLAGLDEFLGYIKRFNNFNSNELNYNNKIVKYFMNTFDTNLETLISVLNNMGAEQISRMDVFNKRPHFSTLIKIDIQMLEQSLRDVADDVIKNGSMTSKTQPLCYVIINKLTKLLHGDPKEVLNGNEILSYRKTEICISFVNYIEDVIESEGIPFIYSNLRNNIIDCAHSLVTFVVEYNKKNKLNNDTELLGRLDNRTLTEIKMFEYNLLKLQGSFVHDGSITSDVIKGIKCIRNDFLKIFPDGLFPLMNGINFSTDEAQDAFKQFVNLTVYEDLIGELNMIPLEIINNFTEIIKCIMESINNYYSRDAVLIRRTSRKIPLVHTIAYGTGEEKINMMNIFGKNNPKYND